MNREQLDTRNTAAITRWWVTMRDTGRVMPELLDDLAKITEQYAADHAERVTARRELREQAVTPPLVAASPGISATTGSGTTAPAVTPSPSTTHRTRTRTRGSAG